MPPSSRRNDGSDLRSLWRGEVVVHGWYHTDNYGDLLLLELLGRELRRRYGVTPVCPTLARSERGRVGAEYRPAAAVRPLAGIMGGGGYFNDRGGDRAHTRGLLRYSLAGRWWRATRVPYVVVGVGAGPWLSGVGAARVRAACAGARAVAVRDEESRQVLADAGVPEGRVEVTADIAMALRHEDLPAESVRRAAELLGPRHEARRLLGVHLQTLVHQGPGLERILEAIVGALPRDGSVEAVYLFDRSPAPAVERRVRAFAEGRPLRVLGHQHFLTTAAVIGGLDAVLSSKLHVAVTGWALGVPTCGYATHPKTRRFYRQIGRLQFHADAWSEPPEVTSRWVRALVGRDPALLDAAPRDAAELRRLALRNYEIVDEHLGARLGSPPGAAGRSPAPTG